MSKKLFFLVDKLQKRHSLSTEEYRCLVEGFDMELLDYIAPLALSQKKKVYGNSIFIRGLIEISNICKNDCYYCGIRASNQNCVRYRLTEEEILNCCEIGYPLGFRTFVLQGGEDGFFDDDTLCSVITKIKSHYPDCAVTLSMGERSPDSYKALKNAGADRYLLRHETYDSAHYSMLHPESMSFENRINCLKTLKSLGYQTGCGFMVGSPYQSADTIAKDLKFIETFRPEMCGMGPFIPHKDTRFAKHPAGSVDLTCFLVAIVRLIHPEILLPATTALATLTEDGRERAIMCGANVIMPNLSPDEAKKNYTLYDNKAISGTESAKCLDELKKSLAVLGAEIKVARGDIKNERNEL